MPTVHGGIFRPAVLLETSETRWTMHSIKPPVTRVHLQGDILATHPDSLVATATHSPGQPRTSPYPKTNVFQLGVTAL